MTEEAIRRELDALLEMTKTYDDTLIPGDLLDNLQQWQWGSYGWLSPTSLLFTAAWRKYYYPAMDCCKIWAVDEAGQPIFGGYSIRSEDETVSIPLLARHDLCEGFCSTNSGMQGSRAIEKMRSCKRMDATLASYPKTMFDMRRFAAILNRLEQLEPLQLLEVIKYLIVVAKKIRVNRLQVQAPLRSNKLEPVGFLDVFGSKFAGNRAVRTCNSQEEPVFWRNGKQHSIMSNASDVIWLADLEGCVTYVSPAVNRVLGYMPTEVLMLTPRELLTEASLHILREALLRAGQELREGKPNIILELQMRRRDGQYIWTESVIDLQRDEANRVLGYLGVTRDITERHRESEQARQPYELHLRNEFFNGLLQGTLVTGFDLFVTAARYHIQLPSRYTLYLLQRNPVNVQVAAAEGACLSAALTNHIHSRENYIAWESPDGIGVLVAREGMTSGPGKEQEIAEAAELVGQLIAAFPRFDGSIGIAPFVADGFGQFSHRYRQAKEAIRCGWRFHPAGQIYHYLNGGVLQFLSPFAGGTAAAEYVAHTLGPLLTYDRINQTDLVCTLETILYSDNLKIAAEKLFFHHKTIVLRKQRIEKVLGQSIDSFDTKLTLGLALKLFHMAKIPVEPEGLD